MDTSQLESLIGPPVRRAMTLVEVVAATMIVGLMAVVTLAALGAAARTGQSAGNRAIGYALASDLMAEIIAAPYSDPDDTPVFGPEGAESDGPRNQFDDVDDYNGWDSQPPQYADGTTIPDRDGWRRQVTVELVRPSQLTQLTTGAADEGAKRVHVVVSYDGQTSAEQFFVRTDDD